ncbi:MAG: VWA domain-containing protein [Polyangiaceae bacterium]|nr:VWA domain-containing protein [Polyangiaceae bacterium]
MACGDDAENGGYGGGGVGPGAGPGTVSTKASGTSGSATHGTGSGPGTGPGGQPPSPDPLVEFVPAECAELDQSQPSVLFLSADDSNSMASPVRARDVLLNHGTPYDIRTFEFLNYYRIDYPAPEYPALAIYPDLKNATAPGDYDLQIGVRSFDALTPRRPITLTLVLDTSGSMEGERMDRLKAVVKAMATQLKPGDIVSAVSWNTSNLVLLDGHTVAGPNDPTLLGLANGLTSNGGTDLHAGLVAGYDLAAANYGSMRLNRVVLISDGEANTGITDEELIALHSEDADEEGIYMVGIAVGPGGNDALMNVVTDKGRGASLFIDSVAEATAIFTTRFDEVMEVAARSVEVELTLPWYFQMHDFFGEEFSRDPTQVEPQHLAPSDAMVLNQVIRACDPSVVVGSDKVRVDVRWTTPLGYLDNETSVELTIDQLLAAPSPHLAKGKAIVAYAEALKTGTQADLHAAHEKVVAANPGNDVELGEIQHLLESHANF